MDSLEDAGGHGSGELGRIQLVHYVDVFRTYDYIDRDILAEAFIYAFEFVAYEADLPVLEHHSVQYVGLADEIGHKGVHRFVVDVRRGAYLLDLALIHHDYGVGEGQGLLLVVGDVDEGDAQLLMHLLELYLHILAHLEVERRQRFVKQQHLWTVHQGTGYGYALLLTA